MYSTCTRAASDGFIFTDMKLGKIFSSTVALGKKANECNFQHTKYSFKLLDDTHTKKCCNNVPSHETINSPEACS